MAIDTEVKRKSIAAIGHRHNGPAVVADSSFDQADRQAIGYGYAGILAGGAAPPAVYRLINNQPLLSLVDGSLAR